MAATALRLRRVSPVSESFDGRDGRRPALLAVDSIATLPLDAAAIQRGYQS